MARPGRAFESRIRVKEDGRAAFSERQNARLSWPRFDSIDEPKSPCRPSSNRRSPCHLHRSTVKKKIYIYIFLLVHIAIKRKKNFASTAGTTGKSSRDFPFHCRIEGPSTELVKLGELLTREEGKSVERTIEEIYITSLCCILIPVVVVASFRQCHLWTVLNSTPWPKFQWRAQSCRPRGNGNRDTE